MRFITTTFFRRKRGACRFHEVSPAPSVVVGAGCAGGVAGGQPHALPGPLARREQRRARGGDGRRLALRQGSEASARLERIGATAEARASVAYWLPRVADTFGPAQSDRFDRLRAMGLRRTDNETLRRAWRTTAEATLAPLRLI